jgi:hypothetical protein
MRAAAVVEKAGVRSVALTATGFDLQAKTIARAEGLKSCTLAVYPGVIMTDGPDVFRAKIHGTILPAVLEGLTGVGDDTAQVAVPPDVVSPDVVPPDVEVDPAELSYAPTDVVYRGDLDEIQDFFEQRLWGDGLPIVPPSPDKVRRFVDASGREGDEVIGVLLPAHREATVWSIAANAVMAGCRPEYMPVLVAIVECLADPDFRTCDAGSTPGWEPLVVLSGPVVQRLNFNFGAGAARIGRRANSTVGRFTRLYLRNVAGLMIPPGATDQAAFGYNFHVALAENEAALNEMGWPTLREDEGFPASVSTVSVQSVVTISAAMYSAGSTAPQHLNTIAPMFCNAIGPGSCYGQYYHGELYTLLAMCPGVAAAIAQDGWSKDDVRAYLGKKMRINAAIVNDRAAGSSGAHGFRVEMTEMGRRVLAGQGIDPETTRSEDIAMPALVDIDRMAITVAGNPSRNQTRGFVGNHVQGVRTTRAIRDV